MRVTINNGSGKFRRVRREVATQRGMTLIELLVVLVIIGMLAVFTLPAMKNVRQSNALVSAGRQLVDDLALARARAISDQTKVFMVFIPPTILTEVFSFGPAENKLAERLKSGLFTSYAIVSERKVGDQPGRGVPRYILDWKPLPDGVLLATNKLMNPSNNTDRAVGGFPEAEFVFPSATVTNKYVLPYVGFDNRGRLLDPNGAGSALNGEILPLVKGSILYVRDAVVNLDVSSFDVRQSETNLATRHHVVIDGLTGRARVETQALY